jgi:hypothetical protein
LLLFVETAKTRKKCKGKEQKDIPTHQKNKATTLVISFFFAFSCVLFLSASPKKKINRNNHTRTQTHKLSPLSLSLSRSWREFLPVC